ISVHSFETFFFHIGIPIYETTIDIETTSIAIVPNQTIKKTEGQFQFTSDHKVYFHSQWFFFKFFRFSTPFPFKAVGTIRPDNTIDIIARLPLGATLTFLALPIVSIAQRVRPGEDSGLDSSGIFAV